MKIKLLFFAATADRSKTRSAEVELPPGSRVDHLAELVVANYPALRDLRLVYAVNESYVSPSRPLNDGDEVAVFTPVSGG